MNDDNPMALEDERRRFFRIQDLVHLTYRVISESELTERTALLEKGLTEQFMVMSSLAAITTEMTATLRKIEVANPDVAEYLRAVDRKIDLLGQALMLDEMSVSEDRAAAVSLSASGIAFEVEKPLPEGEPVEVKLMLMPSCAGVLAYGTVITNDKVSVDGETVTQARIDFTHLRDEDRDLLIKHVIRKQGDMLRERRAARENAND